MRGLRRFRALSPRRRRLALRSVLVVTAVRIGLTALPFARLRAVLRRIESRPTRATDKILPAEELAWAVSRVSRYVPRATCLVQAMALELLLARAGHPAELRIGVAKEHGELVAHAWVETDGQRLLEDSEPTSFAALPTGWQG